MHHGKIVEMGKPFDLVAQYQAESLEQMFIELISGQEEDRAQN